MKTSTTQSLLEAMILVQWPLGNSRRFQSLCSTGRVLPAQYEKLPYSREENMINAYEFCSKWHTKKYESRAQLTMKTKAAQSLLKAKIEIRAHSSKRAFSSAFLIFVSAFSLCVDVSLQISRTERGKYDTSQSRRKHKNSTLEQYNTKTDIACT